MADDQLTATDLDTMSHDQIIDAQNAGQLDRLLGLSETDIDVKHRARHGGTITQAEADRLNELRCFDLVSTAGAEGRIA